jgi:hypothetical protein
MGTSVAQGSIADKTAGGWEMTNRVLALDADQTIAMLGLFLMVAVARLANRGYSVQHAAGWSEDLARPARGLSSFLARRAIDGIAALGWIADHLPQSAPNGGM